MMKVQRISTRTTGAFDATAREPVTLRLGGRVSVTVGDSGAIWRVHQHARADFDSLFEILARQPDTDMEFVCEAE